MKQQSLTWFSWKKLIITCIVLLIVGLLIYFYMTLRHIQASQVTGFDQTEEYILAHTDMEVVDEMFGFQEESFYHIAYSRDKQNNSWIQYIPFSKVIEEDKEIAKEDKEAAEENEEEKEEKEDKEEKPKKIVEIEREDTLSQSEIESIWTKECDECELKGSTPAILDDVPLWELTYVDRNNRYVIEYRHLTDGETYEQLKLNRKYNVKG